MTSIERIGVQFVALLLAALFLYSCVYLNISQIFTIYDEIYQKISLNKATNCSNWLNEKFQAYVLCLQIQILTGPDNLIPIFSNLLKGCHRNVTGAANDTSFLNVTYFTTKKNPEEPKAAILNDKLTSSSGCNVVTLGIGQTIEAELSIRERMPW